MTQKEMTYEGAMQRLEALAREMEAGDVAIDSLAEKLKEAQQLLAYCKAQLTKAEAEVQKLLKEEEWMREKKWERANEREQMREEMRKSNSLCLSLIFHFVLFQFSLYLCTFAAAKRQRPSAERQTATRWLPEE